MEDSEQGRRLKQALCSFRLAQPATPLALKAFSLAKISKITPAAVEHTVPHFRFTPRKTREQGSSMPFRASPSQCSEVSIEAQKASMHSSPDKLHLKDALSQRGITSVHHNLQASTGSHGNHLALRHHVACLRLLIFQLAPSYSPH